MDSWAAFEAMVEEEGAKLGDPRRCSVHPEEVIGSPCGLFDGVCGACEELGEDDPAVDAAARFEAAADLAEARFELVDDIPF